jgi:hypothetical protein
VTEKRALAIAFVAHAALAAAVMGIPLRAGGGPGLAKADFEIAVEDVIPEAPPVAAPSLPEHVGAEARAAARGAERDARGAGAARARGGEAAPEASASSAPSDAEAPWSFHATPPGVAEGTFRVPSPRDRAASPLERNGRPDEQLLDAPPDHSLGLGFAAPSGGPVVSAVHAAAAAVADARDGEATIEVVTDAAGHVVAVRLLDSTSDEQAWKEAARAIAAVLQGRTLAVPHGARGVAVTVHVEVAMRLPSGAKAGSGVTPHGLGIGFDVADIGARAKPVVHASIVGERRL